MLQAQTQPLIPLCRDRMKRLFRRFVRCQRGSIVIEAALTMPLIFLFTVVLLAVGLLAYQRSDFTRHAYEWSERAAYVWKDSHQEPVTGAFTYKNMDDVYSSIVSEGLGWMGAVFHQFQQAAVSFPDHSVSGQSLSAAKLLRSSDLADSDVAGQGVYYNRLLEGEVRADWQLASATGKQPFPLFPASKLQLQASGYYADPVQFLRNMDLVVTYTAKLKQYFSNPQSAADAIKEVLPKQEAKPAIRSEAQAKQYLQQLLGATGTKLQTAQGERIIDVLDSDGVGHEAKYTVNKTDAKLQIAKDGELIRTGQVKGVIWHFFYVEKLGRYDTTSALLQLLEENGIMVVYHK